VLTLFYPGDEINEDEMEGACATSVREEKRTQSFGGENPSKEIALKT